MLQTIEKSEMAKRKPYTYSSRTIEKMQKIRKEKQIKKNKLINVKYDLISYLYIDDEINSI